MILILLLYVVVGPVTSPCPDESYPSQFGWLSGSQTPVEAYVGIKRLYQGILYEGSGQSVIPGSNKQLLGVRSCCLAHQKKAQRTAHTAACTHQHC